MSTVGQPERATQDRVVALFRDELGYRYVGDWTDRDGNSNTDEPLLSAWLTGRGYSAAQIGVALHKLRTEAANPIAAGIVSDVRMSSIELRAFAGKRFTEIRQPHPAEARVLARTVSRQWLR